MTADEEYFQSLRVGTEENADPQPSPAFKEIRHLMNRQACG
jgi:hypothetical protein